jgi:hypothetical protein
VQFDHVLKDIHKLAGLRLRSIGGRSDITLESVDDRTGQLTVRSQHGALSTRPVAELRRIWTELCIRPAVHVDSFLGGSGSSRSQPETVLANLPFVEWLRCTRRKHIAWVRANTHPAGTIRQMDPVGAEEVRQKLRSVDGAAIRTVIIADDVASAVRELEAATGLTMETVEQGVYSHQSPRANMLLVLREKAPGLAVGTYLVVPLGQLSPDGPKLAVGGQELSIVVRSGVTYLAESH